MKNQVKIRSAYFFRLWTVTTLLKVSAHPNPQFRALSTLLVIYPFAFRFSPYSQASRDLFRGLSLGTFEHLRWRLEILRKGSCSWNSAEVLVSFVFLIIFGVVECLCR